MFYKFVVSTQILSIKAECHKQVHLSDYTSAISVSKIASAVSNLVIFGPFSGSFLSSSLGTYFCVDVILCL